MYFNWTVVDPFTKAEVSGAGSDGVLVIDRTNSKLVGFVEVMSSNTNDTMTSAAQLLA